ncbi:MAG: ABC transporter ATP-binding protein [Microthrixaceae bacterium]
MQSAIQVDGLTKSYGDLQAVRGVGFEVAEGECFGILGPNGAGKTTTLEIIEGLREPDDGVVSVFGQSPWPRNPRLMRLIGVQLQATAFILSLTAREQLSTMADIYGSPASRPDEVLELVDLTDMADTDAMKLSGGQQQRLSIGLALVHKPRLLFLDEPSTGLDPGARRSLWGLLDKIRADGTTLVITTHYMEEAEVLCDRVAIMDHGSILAMDTPAALVRELDASTSILLPPGALPLDEASSLDGIETAENTPGALTLKTRDPARVLTLLADRSALGGVQVRSANLEDVFVNLTGRQLLDVEQP